MRIQHSRRTGRFTLVEIMIVVAIIGLLAAIAIPSFVRAREKAQQTVCISNLKAIDGVKGTWGFGDETEQHRHAGGCGLVRRRFIHARQTNCPASGTYSLNQVDARPAGSVPTHTL